MAPPPNTLPNAGGGAVVGAAENAGVAAKAEKPAEDWADAGKVPKLVAAALDAGAPKTGAVGGCKAGVDVEKREPAEGAAAAALASAGVLPLPANVREPRLRAPEPSETDDRDARGADSADADAGEAEGNSEAVDAATVALAAAVCAEEDPGAAGEGKRGGFPNDAADAAAADDAAGADVAGAEDESERPPREGKSGEVAALDTGRVDCVGAAARGADDGADDAADDAADIAAEVAAEDAADDAAGSAEGKRLANEEADAAGCAAMDVAVPAGGRKANRLPEAEDAAVEAGGAPKRLPEVAVADVTAAVAEGKRDSEDVNTGALLAGEGLAFCAAGATEPAAGGDASAGCSLVIAAADAAPAKQRSTVSLGARPSRSRGIGQCCKLRDAE